MTNKTLIERIKNFTIQWIPLLPATYLLALAIWVYGLYHSYSTCKSIQGLAVGQISSVAQFLWVLFWMSAVHQLLIFRSLHKLDYNKDTKKQFEKWIDTWPDWLLRLCAICLILCVGGEIPRAISLMKTSSAYHQEQSVYSLKKYTKSIANLDDLFIGGETNRTLVFIKAQTITNPSQEVYVLERNSNYSDVSNATILIPNSEKSESANGDGLPWFSFFLFASLCVWDCCAIATIVKRKEHRVLPEMPAKDIPNEIAKNWDKHAWIFFASSDLLALISWAIVLVALHKHSEIANYLSFFLCFYSAIIVSRLFFEVILPVLRKTLPLQAEPLNEI